MKKILLILSIFISAISFGQGKIANTGDVIPTGLYPIVKSNNVKGTLHSVQSFSDMYAIPPNTRDTGMLCYVRDSSITYQLFNGITNADWTVFSTGSIYDTFYVQKPLYVFIDQSGHRVIAIEHEDGLVSGGIVTWSGTGLKFYISPAQYWIQGIYYTSGLDSTTLATADPTYSRYDLFIVDTTGHGKSVTGAASMSPVVPQPDLGSQLSLTNAFLVNPGDTVPNNVSTTTVYDENLGAPTEWVSHTQGTPMTIDFGNTDNPQKGTKDIFISKYRNGSVFYFNTSTPYQLTSDAVISGWIYLNGKLTNNIYAILYNSITGASSNFNIIDSRYGLNKLDSGRYQPFVIPTSSFTWVGGNTNNQFNTLEFAFYGQGDTSGAKGLYFDNITLQKGINNITPPTDYSNKLDSVPLHKYISGTDTLNVRTQYAKGVPLAKDTIWTHSGGSSINTDNWDSVLSRQTTPMSNDHTVDHGGHGLEFDNLNYLSINSKTDISQANSYTNINLDQHGTTNVYNDDTSFYELDVTGPLAARDGISMSVTNLASIDRTSSLYISTSKILLAASTSTEADVPVVIQANIDSSNADANNVAWFDDQNILHRGHISTSGGGSGVTSISTGYGLSGGPITSTGTIIVDSAALSAKYVRISDTAAMLSPYQKSLTLTTTGSSGAATLTGSTLNVPNYAGGGGTVTGIYQKITPTAGQTIFLFTLIPTDNNKVSFFVDGVFLMPSLYSISGNTLTTAGGLTINDWIEERGVQ